MILSASRRTDIPAYYFDWFLNRIKEGFLCVRNPINPHQISKLKVTPDVTDCIVFWTKNPIPMLPRLDELTGYTYYFQFTLTSYENDIETNIPDKEKVMLPAFKKLSEKIGKEKVIWRYDPILFTEKYSIDYHINRFEKYCRQLTGYTDRCIISFVDIYSKNKTNMDNIYIKEIANDKQMQFAKIIADIARVCGMEMSVCAEGVNLEPCGISPSHCIDKELIEKLTGYKINVGKDKGQRKECGCAESIETGTYNTCKNGCKYCYANYSPNSVEYNCSLYDAASPLLCSPPIGMFDKVTERKVKSLKGERLSDAKQVTLYDIL